MDELALLKDMADETPLPLAGKLAPARARLTAAIAVQADTVGVDTLGADTVRASTAADAEAAASASGAGVATVRRRRPRRHRRRLAIFGVATVGLAAAITAVVALGPLEQVGIAPPAASAEQVLLDAAAAARAEPDVVPRPDQFVYTRTQLATGDAWETWLSVDGTRDGMKRGPDGQTWSESACQPTLPKCPSRGYDPDLPTDADGMRSYLSDESDIGITSKLAVMLLQDQYVPPASRAAVFELLAEIDGFTLVDHAVDGAGRSGIGLRRDSEWVIVGPDGASAILVFDKDTHAYLGLAAGDGTDGRRTVGEQAFVDEVGQRP